MTCPIHAPFERLVPGACQAVLFVHGILSTPRFWDDFVQAVPPDVSVVSVLLPGHGGSVADFGRVPWGAWQSHVDQTVDRLLATHSRVYLVGHSMGALLSILRAVRCPEGIAGLILMAVPLRIAVKPSAVVHNMLKGVGLAESPEELASYYGTSQDWRVWRYIPWIPRYLELFRLSRDARRALPGLTVPTRAFMHGRDELVSRRSCRLLEACPAVTLTMLPDSMHHDISEPDRALILAALRETCARS